MMGRGEGWHYDKIDILYFTVEYFFCLQRWQIQSTNFVVLCVYVRVCVWKGGGGGGGERKKRKKKKKGDYI